MANLIIEVPDDLARNLERIAAAEHKSVQQLAVERLRTLIERRADQPGSANAVLSAMAGPPHLSSSDVDQLEAAIAAGRIPVQAPDLFRNDQP